MANANTSPPRPQLGMLGLMIWATCFGVLFALIAFIDRIDRRMLGAARLDSPAHQKERWFLILVFNLILLGILVGEWPVTWACNRQRLRRGLPPMTMKQRWDWLIPLFIKVLTGVLLGGFCLIVAPCIKIVMLASRIVVSNDPPTATGLRIAVGLVLVVVLAIPVFNLAMVVLVWSLIPFLWAWHKLSGLKNGGEPTAEAGP
jgi:hypothetical protein